MRIEYQNVDIVQEEHVILKGVNFQAEAGEFIYLTGKVGTGKSSLLKTFYGELDVHTGSARVLDREMTKIKRRHIPALRKRLGIVFQDFQLLNDRTVRANLDFVLKATGWKKKKERNMRIHEVLEQVGMTAKADQMPYQLSGGEQQCVCIARAILNRPDIILADEATGNLDKENGRRATAILYDISKAGTTVVLSTHNEELISEFPGVVYRCGEGRLQECTDTYTSQDYYDTLVDDAHIFTYAVELVKLFSDAKGDYANVEFIMQNASDKYYVKAELNKEKGVYYVVDHVADEKDATHFVPVKNADGEGLVIIKGLEDDTYTVTEVRTDSGYTLLKDNIKIVISQAETTELCDIYTSDLLGLIQNDPRYATIINDTGDLKNMPQPHLEHHLRTASATVDNNKVNMLDDDGSANAIVPLKVVNTRGFDLPQTGDSGTMAFSIVGILLMACAVVVIVAIFRKKNTTN